MRAIVDPAGAFSFIDRRHREAKFLGQGGGTFGGGPARVRALAGGAGRDRPPPAGPRRGPPPRARPAAADNRPPSPATSAPARRGLRRYLAFYNRQRPHSALGGQTPDQAYFNQPKPTQAAA